jgi:outer membrane immunogenic protein
MDVKYWLWTTSIAAIVASAPAYAADLPTYKAPPAPPAPVFTWTGGYLGAAAGGAWTGDTTDVVPGSPPLDIVYLNGAGVVGGPYVGYNW